MRRVTAKPPNMLMVVSVSPMKAMIRIQMSGRPGEPGGQICSSAPIAMI